MGWAKKYKCSTCIIEGRSDHDATGHNKATHAAVAEERGWYEKRTYTCSTCRREGHNVRTCPERKGAQELLDACRNGLRSYDGSVLGKVMAAVESVRMVPDPDADATTAEADVALVVLQPSTVKAHKMWTPLHFACRLDNQPGAPVVTYLLALLSESGADVDVADEDSVTPLQLASFWLDEDPDATAAKLLLEHGADATHRDKHGSTALDYARSDETPAVRALEHPLPATKAAAPVRDFAVRQNAVRLACEEQMASVEDKRPPGRRALVIGNATYGGKYTLPMGEADAKAVAAALTHYGFDVASLTNLDKAATEAAFEEFRDSSVDGDLAVVYFSGHGFTRDGTSYLEPVPAGGDADADPDPRFNLQKFVQAFSNTQQGSTLVVLVDACQTKKARQGSSQRAASTDSTLSSTLPRRILSSDRTAVVCCYAAEPGDPAHALDRRLSPFTEALVRVLADHGVRISEHRPNVAEVLCSVQDLCPQVLRDRGHTTATQLPFLTSSAGMALLTKEL